MKEKLLWAVVVLLGVMLIASNAQAPSSQASRYQLLAGTHDVTTETQISEQHDIFRIDTATGATSYYFAGRGSDGKIHSEWLPIR